jgi:hypothetical protein
MTDRSISDMAGGIIGQKFEIRPPTHLHIHRRGLLRYSYRANPKSKVPRTPPANQYIPSLTVPQRWIVGPSPFVRPDKDRLVGQCQR